MTGVLARASGAHAATAAHAAPTVTVVPPDDVPPGATVVGLVVVLPRPGEVALRAVTPAADAWPQPGAPPVPAAAASASSEARSSEPPAHTWLRPGLTLDRAGRSATRDGEPLDLTRREFDLLAHLADRPGRVLTRDHLLAGVWGHADPRWVGRRTVDVHVARLRRKLGDVHGVCIRTVRGVGYRWTP